MGGGLESVGGYGMVGLDNADSCDFGGRAILGIVKQESHELAMREIEGNRELYVCI